MTEENGVEISYRPLGGHGKILITARFPDGTAFTDRLDVTSDLSRARFLQRLCEGRGGVDRLHIEMELQKIARERVETSGSTHDESQADRVVEIALGAELFHTPGGHDSEGYAAIDHQGHREVWPINSRAFKRWLARKFHEAHGKVPGSQALQDALNVISGSAIYEGTEREVAIRIAFVNGDIYIDMADPNWRVIEITNSGWRVISAKDAPARFIRKAGMLPLPEPVRGGTIEELRPLVNLADERSWVLLVACIVTYLRARGPYPILIIDGEQGSAKSTLCRVVLQLIDPRKAGLRRPPREERDLMIAASNSLVVGFDNLSGLPTWISDALCSLACGGGFSTRALFTDDEEKVFDAMRPVLLNGIDSVASRSDLLDRAVQLHLPTIPEHKRRPEKTFWAAFEAVRPRVLGALLDGVVVALRDEGTVKLSSFPRMADFATWATAAEGALGWTPGTFMAAYVGNRQEAHELAIESASIGAAILGLMRKSRFWEGTSKELKHNLESNYADQKTLDRRDWPKTPEGMRGELLRLTPNLRAIGINVWFLPRTGDRRSIRLEWARERGPTAAVPRSGGSPLAGDGSGVGNGHCGPQPGDPENSDCDGHDGHDGSPHTQSHDGAEEVAEWQA